MCVCKRERDQQPRTSDLKHTLCLFLLAGGCRVHFGEARQSLLRTLNPIPLKLNDNNTSDINSAISVNKLLHTILMMGRMQVPRMIISTAQKGEADEPDKVPLEMSSAAARVQHHPSNQP